MSLAANLVVRPVETGIAAEIEGLDLAAPLAEDGFDAWRQAFEAHAVLVLRGQRIDDATQVAVSRRFGPLEDFPDPKDQAPGFPTVLRVSNVDKETGRIRSLDDAGFRSFWLGTSDWHTDSSFRPVPSMASLLHAREVPAEGGDTLFADTEKAWAALPAARHAALEGLRVVHDFEQTRRRFGLPPRPAAIRKANPPVSQPLAARLPDGRRALLLGMHASHVDGMEAAASRALLDELAAWSTRPEFVYRHRWRPGDLVMWDNRRTMHRACPYDIENERRVLHRTTVAGQGRLG